MIIDLFLDTKHEHVAEFKLAIKHSLELIHHIKGEHGALQWSNRFKLISENQPLRLQMERMDFICLQECSSPDDLHKMMNARDERFAKLSYKTNPSTDDHCVILYDQQKFELERKVEYAIEGKKPSIFARFRPKDKPEQAFIVASIHYPGGDHELLETLIAQAHSLKSNANEKIEYFMLGDYNHTEAFFDKMGEKETHLFYPVRGTMAGSDYGNTNNAIDAVCTNVDSTQIDVRQLDALSHACPSSEKLDVSFESEQRPLITFKKDVKITPMATPNLTMFGHAVQSRVDASDARQAVKFLGTAESKRSTITVI